MGLDRHSKSAGYEQVTNNYLLTCDLNVASRIRTMGVRCLGAAGVMTR